MVSTPPTPPRPGEPWSRDEDPTGIRHLLGSLPDPGPVPPELVERINATLAAEQAAREARHQTVVPLRPRRRRTIGLVAAAAAVIAIGVPALVTGTGPGAVTALFRDTSTQSQAAGGATSESPADKGGPERGPAQDSGGRAMSPTGPVGIHLSDTAYTSGGFPEQAAAFRDNPGEPLRTLAAEAPSIGPMGTEKGLRQCLEALGVEAWKPVLADLATFDGGDAIVFVISSDTGQSAIAVARPCTRGQVERLAEVDPLP